MAIEMENVRFRLKVWATESGHYVAGKATVEFKFQAAGETMIVVNVNRQKHEFVTRDLRPNQTDARRALHLALNGEADRQAKLKAKPELAAGTRSAGRLKRRQAQIPKR